MPKFLLAIDQGTTGSTISILNLKGQPVATVNQEYRQIFPKPGWVEHKPEDIWESVLSTIQKCLRKAKAKGTEIAAMKTGLVIDPYFSASKMRWILNNVNGVRAKAENGTLAAGTIDSYLLWRLTAGQEHATDVSNASRTLLMDISKAKWDDDLLKFFHVPKALLPEIRDSAGFFGETKGLKVLPDGIPITGIAGDQQAALFGQTCFEEGESKCTFGTGSFLLINSGKKRIHSKSGLLTTAAWRLKGEEMTYALEGGAFICGAAVQFLRDQLGFIKSSKDIETLAREVKSAEGVEFVPALAGLGAPHWNPHARGIICGLTRGTTRGHIARATLEAMALQNTEILIAMQKDLGRDLKDVRVDG
ncbi:MAG: glycerol kinase, partial [Proteobacteria bacterium]